MERNVVIIIFFPRPTKIFGVKKLRLKDTERFLPELLISSEVQSVSSLPRFVYTANSTLI